jgi:hypothetical protein
MTAGAAEDLGEDLVAADPPPVEDEAAGGGAGRIWSTRESDAILRARKYQFLALNRRRRNNLFSSDHFLYPLP